MPRIKIAIFTLLAIMAFSVLNGCAVYDASVDERNVSTQAKDAKIKVLIKSDFLQDDDVKYLDYDVFCYTGHVYLIGEYTSRKQADKAIAIARKIEGVRQVTTYLLPKKDLPYCGTTDSLGYKLKLRKALVEDENIWSTNIDISMVQCEAVLLGIVGSTKERSLAIAHAKKIKGIRKVKSFLKVAY